MPFINVKYSGEIENSSEEKIKSGLGSAVAILGKSEGWLMVGFEDNCRLYFNGEKSEKIAFVEVSLYGSANDGAYNMFTGEVCRILHSELGVPVDKIYVKYSPTENWGWNGSNF